MSMNKSWLVVLSAALIAALSSCGTQAGDNNAAPSPPNDNSTSSRQHDSKTTRLIGTIHMPGNSGFTDYMVVSPETHRLYAGYRTENKLFVLDTQTNSVIASIGHLAKVCSVALVPERNLGFTSNRGEDTVGVIDLTTNKLLRKLSGGHGPDAIVYNAAANLVCVSNHEGRSITLIDPATEKSRTIRLGGLAEYVQAEPKTGIIYQNLEDTGEVAVIDPTRNAVVARYKTAPGEEPTGLALDAEHRRLFVACGNEKLVILDADNGRLVATLPIGAGVDFAAYDSTLRRIYTANGRSGTMTIIHQDSADQYALLENVPTRRGGHALAIDPVTHRVYVTYGGSEIDVFEAVIP